MESRKIRRKLLFENSKRKTRRKQLAENSQAENSSQEQKIISEKFSVSFVNVLCYKVLKYYEVLHCKL